MVERREKKRGRGVVNCSRFLFIRIRFTRVVVRREGHHQGNSGCNEEVFFRGKGEGHGFFGAIFFFLHYTKMQNSCIEPGAVEDCQLTPIQRKCYTDQVNHYMGTNIIHMKLSTYMTRRQNPPKKQPAYFYSVIDKSKYCDGKTPKVLKAHETCTYGSLCCKQPPYYEYNSNKKRFYTTDISILKNVDSCDPGKCKRSGKKCFNDTDCPGEGLRACTDPINMLQKTAYEVQIYKNGTWSNVEPYTPKSKHPYYIFQEEKRKEAAAAAAQKKRDDAAAAAAQKKRDDAALTPSNIWQSLASAFSNPLNSIA